MAYLAESEQFPALHSAAVQSQLGPPHRERGALFNLQSQLLLHVSTDRGKRRQRRDSNRIVSELRTWQELGVGYVFLSI